MSIVTGTVDEFGHPKIPLTVTGLRGRVTMAATVDTGFDGYLCLPTEIAIQIGLELSGRLVVELADGSRRTTLVFAGTVTVGENAKDVDIILTEADEPLVGTGLLAETALTIDFPQRTVELRRESPSQ
jgi:clan AA aspartic protease